MILANRITAFFITILLSLSSSAIAAELAIPKTFSKGEPANADQVNANFAAVETAVDDNNDKIVILSAPKSITYPAMGFTPENNNIQFSKDRNDGSLSVDGDARLFHSLSLSSGIKITRIRVHVRDESGGAQVTVDLKKKELRQDPISLVTVNANVSEGDDPEQVFEQDLAIAESIVWSETGPLPTYYLEVFFNGSGVYLYSVTLDYEYIMP
jgi:hypothetical protein